MRKNNIKITFFLLAFKFNSDFLNYLLKKRNSVHVFVINVDIVYEKNVDLFCFYKLDKCVKNIFNGRQQNSLVYFKILFIPRKMQIKVLTDEKCPNIPNYHS